MQRLDGITHLIWRWESWLARVVISILKTISVIKADSFSLHYHEIIDSVFWGQTPHFPTDHSHVQAWMTRRVYRCVLSMLNFNGGVQVIHHTFKKWNYFIFSQTTYYFHVQCVKCCKTINSVKTYLKENKRPYNLNIQTDWWLSEIKCAGILNLRCLDDFCFSIIVWGFYIVFKNQLYCNWCN